MTNIFKFVFFFLWLVVAFCPALVSAAQIEGVVLSEKGPIADSQVTAYPAYASFLKKQNGIHSTPGEKPGQYRLTLPPGKYYLVAHGTEKATPLFGYHGLNPIHVDEEYRWVPIIVMATEKVVCKPGFQGVGGRVVYKGKPVANSSISVYALKDEPFRGMGLFTNTVPEDGSYWFDLDPGSYVLLARKRSGGGAIGPIMKGDLLCYFSGNPVQVSPGQSCTADVTCYPRDDIDAYLAKDADDPRGKKEQKRRSASLRKVDEADSARLMTGEIQRAAFVSGRVTTLNGLPLGNLYISAYPADEVALFQMFVLRMKTEHMTRTDEKGFFRLELRSGSYYLVARERLGDAPIAGEYYGIFEGTPNHSITLEPNEIKTGVHIVAESIMP